MVRVRWCLAELCTLQLSRRSFLFPLLRLSHALPSLEIISSVCGFVWVTPRYDDDPRDPGRCPVQRGPAGGAAAPGPAAMHRAAALLHHVPGWCCHFISKCRLQPSQHCSALTLPRLLRRPTLTQTSKTETHLWPESPATSSKPRSTPAWWDASDTLSPTQHTVRCVAIIICCPWE